MNSDTLPLIPSLAYPTGHPLLLAPAVSATGTTQTAFLLANGGPAVAAIPLQTAVMGSMISPDPNSNPAFSGPATPYNPNAQIAAPYFNSSSFDFARAFRLRALGTYTSANAANGLTFVVALGSSATFGSDTSFFAPAAFTAIPTATKGHFWIEATCEWDSNSGKIDGIGEAYCSNSGTPLGTRTAISPVSAAAPANLSFVLFYTWLVGASANTIQLTELNLERV